MTDEKRKRSFDEEQKKIAKNMKGIKFKVAVMSGKGGVGKSTVAANMAVAFAAQGYDGRVGILDIDIHGPCIPKLLGVKGRKYQISPSGNGAVPVLGPMGVKVVSMDFLLEDQVTPVIWRGPLKMHIIRQFLSDFEWGELDFLFIDAPPGTGDEPLSLLQSIPDMDGIIIVTIPSEVSGDVVKKAISFSRKMDVPIIGIVENMSGFVCPNCGTEINIFGKGEGQRIANELDVPFIGKIPIDPKLCEEADKGIALVVGHVNSATVKAFMNIVKKVEDFLMQKKAVAVTTQKASMGSR
jgi:ATP-binding protein involved in chromosome partitioning